MHYRWCLCCQRRRSAMFWPWIFADVSFVVAGKSVNTTPLIAILIPDRTGSTRSHLLWRCFPDAMNGSWSHMEIKSPEVSISFAFCSSVSLCSTNQEQICLPKSSWTMVCAVSLLMPNSFAVIVSMSHRSCASICRTFSIISGVLLVDGRLQYGSLSVISFPSPKHLNHSAHSFPSVHLHKHFTCLQFVAELYVCALCHSAVTLTMFNWPQSVYTASHMQSMLCQFSPCLWITMHLCQVTIQIWHHGRLTRWRKWRACDVGEAKEGLGNELWCR